MTYDIPHTEQEMKDFVRFADAEIKRSALKIKKLEEIKAMCKTRLAEIENQLKEVKNVKDNSSGGVEGDLQSS